MPYAQGDRISYAIKVLHNVEELSTCHAVRHLTNWAERGDAVYADVHYRSANKLRARGPEPILVGVSNCGIRL